jgi:hypothetical protein
MGYIMDAILKTQRIWELEDITDGILKWRYNG